MSTKAIREALALVREDKHPEALRKALEAVEAIEKAAVEWVVSDNVELSQQATDVLCAISNEVILRKEAP